jgi:hypothetical protein
MDTPVSPPATESPSHKRSKNMLLLSWKSLLDIMQNLIKTTSDESNIQMLLKAYQSCIGACGSANCYEARDAFLESLCNECVSTISSTGGKDGAHGHGASGKNLSMS